MDIILTLIHSLVLVAQQLVASFAPSFLWAVVITAFIARRLYREKQWHDLARAALEKGQPLPPKS